MYKYRVWGSFAYTQNLYMYVNLRLYYVRYVSMKHLETLIKKKASKNSEKN